jgi:C-terminal processing protease CtpA/Prc
VTAELTAARYFTPSGRSIEANGILPDIDVPHDVLRNPENDKALDTAYALLRGIAFNTAFPPNPHGTADLR